MGQPGYRNAAGAHPPEVRRSDRSPVLTVIGADRHGRPWLQVGVMRGQEARRMSMSARSAADPDIPAKRADA
jgi:hypothetical protein